MDLHQLAGGEQEDQHDEKEHCEAGHNAWANVVVEQGHIPGADTEGEVLVVVEDGRRHIFSILLIINF